MRPPAAREVGARLVELAEAGPGGRVRDLTGPREERLADMVRRMVAFDGVRRRVVEFQLPGKFGRATASGQLRGCDDAMRGTIGFDTWLLLIPGRRAGGRGASRADVAAPTEATGTASHPASGGSATSPRTTKGERRSGSPSPEQPVPAVRPLNSVKSVNETDRRRSAHFAAPCPSRARLLRP